MRVTLENPEHPKVTVAGLSDPYFCDALDDLLQAATEPSQRLMENVFVDNEVLPLNGQLATLGFAAGLFVYHYNEYRAEGYEVEIAFQASQAQVFSHPVVQEGLARMMTQQMNRTVIENER